MQFGKLITFEGLDGCGKSTQLEKAKNWLTYQGCEVLNTRQPGGTRIGKKIREILLNPEHKELYPESELLLYLSDRIQHLTETIIPAKNEGKIVLCDRFHDSTVAYQGYGRGLNLKSIESIINYSIKPHTPDLTFLLTISPKIVVDRLDQRKEHSSKDRLDIEPRSFFERAAKGYIELASAEPGRFVCINGEQEIEVIHQQIISILQDRFKIGSKSKG